VPDPDLQIALGIGIYRIEADLVWFTPSSSLLQYGFYYSGSLNANAANALLQFGILNNATITAVAALSSNSIYTVNQVPNQNTFHVAGTVQTTTPGTFTVHWGVYAGDLISLGAGSALYATPL
jgi:hypothetical protein